MVDTVIRLFESTATEFTTNGLGVLSSAIKCEVVEERNGEFELTMEYPIDGNRYSELALRRLIVAKPNPFDDPQPFRIYNITKPMNGRVTVAAEHISYDLTGYVVRPFTASRVDDALIQMRAKSVTTCPFELETDKVTSAEMKVNVPTSMRALLGGTEGSILDLYGPGEYKFDKFRVDFMSSRGANNGVTIRYGKNLIDLEQEENCAAVYTHVMPYWYSEEDGLFQGNPVSTGGTFNYTRIMPLDLTDKFEEKPTSVSALTQAAQQYIQNNKPGVPKVSINVSFIQLAQSEEYKYYRLLEAVRLCDTVTVEFPKLGVSATSKCIKTTYNVITGKYISLELGEARSNLSATIEKQSAEIAKNSVENNMPIIKAAIDKATKLITGGLGGYVILHSSSNGDTPDELLVLDSQSGGEISQATKVWRFNSGGLGHSSNGYNGPFGLALTEDGEIISDRLTVSSALAQKIRGGILAMGGTTAEGSFGDGIIQVYDANDVLIGQFSSSGVDLYRGAIRLDKTNNSLIEVPLNSAGSYELTISPFSGFKIEEPGSASSSSTGDGAKLYIDYQNNYYDAAGSVKTCNLYTSVQKGSYDYSAALQPGVLDLMNNTLRSGNWEQRRQISFNLDNGEYGIDVFSPTPFRQLIWQWSTGNVYNSGTKSRLMSTEDYNTRALYCYETPSPMFGDIGEGTIGDDGSCYISFDPIFAETINTANYQVQLQKYGQGNCWVSERTGSYFIVEGTPGLSFGWEVKAKQADQSNRRLDLLNLEAEVRSEDYGQLAIEHITQIKEERAA